MVASGLWRQRRAACKQGRAPVAGVSSQQGCSASGKHPPGSRGERAAGLRGRVREAEATCPRGVRGLPRRGASRRWLQVGLLRQCSRAMQRQRVRDRSLLPQGVFSDSISHGRLKEGATRHGRRGRLQPGGCAGCRRCGRTERGR
jgi:hypothetical protein